VYRYLHNLLNHFSVQTSKKPVTFSCILLQLELLAKLLEKLKKTLKTRLFLNKKRKKTFFYIYADDNMISSTIG